MTKYTIKHYQEGFENDQVQIGIAANWALPWQNTADQLREEFAQEGFDPETLLFYFNSKNQMVGFITSQIIGKGEDGIVRARLAFPTVLPEYKDAIEVLFERAIEILKSKNVHVVQSSFGLRGGSPEWGKKWGYKQVEEMGVLYGIDVRSVDFRDEVKDKSSFDPDKDLDDCANIFVTEYGLPEEDVKNYLRAISISDQNLAYYVLRDQENIVATGAVMKNPVVPTIGMLSVMYDKEISYLKQLLSALTSDAKNQGIKKLLMFFTHLTSDHPLCKKYASLGFNYIASNVNFEKKI